MEKPYDAIYAILKLQQGKSNCNGEKKMMAEEIIKKIYQAIPDIISYTEAEQLFNALYFIFELKYASEDQIRIPGKEINNYLRTKEGHRVRRIVFKQA